MRDHGHAAVELALAAGLLLIPVALTVLSFGPWLETRVVAKAAAAEASRAAVLKTDISEGVAVLAEMALNHGLSEERVMLGWCGATPVPIGRWAGSCPMARGTDVRAEVRMWTPLISTPWGEVGGVWVTGTHDEAIDLYRSLG